MGSVQSDSQTDNNVPAAVETVLGEGAATASLAVMAETEQLATACNWQRLEVGDTFVPAIGSGSWSAL